LDAKLAAFGGAVTGRGGRGGGFGGGGRGAASEPGAMQSFIQLNGAFGAIVSAMQVGLDMGPTRAKVDTWETDCRNFNTTVTAWKKVVSDLAAYDVLPTKAAMTPCAFASPAAATATPKPSTSGRRGGGS